MISRVCGKLTVPFMIHHNTVYISVGGLVLAVESSQTGATAPRAFVCPIPPSVIGPKSFHSHLDFDRSSPGLHSSLSAMLTLCA